MTDAAVTAPVLVLSRYFDASPERVFDAWLTPSWAQWLPPRDATCVLSVHEPRVGGRFVADMVMADGRAVSTTGIYREIDQPHRLVLSWTLNYAKGEETIIELDFAPERGGTRLTLRQTGLPSAEQLEGYEAGWGGAGGSFDKLAAVLARD